MKIVKKRTIKASEIHDFIFLIDFNTHEPLMVHNTHRVGNHIMFMLEGQPYTLMSHEEVVQATVIRLIEGDVK